MLPSNALLVMSGCYAIQLTPNLLLKSPDPATGKHLTNVCASLVIVLLSVIELLTPREVPTDLVQRTYQYSALSQLIYSITTGFYGWGVFQTLSAISSITPLALIAPSLSRPKGTSSTFKLTSHLVHHMACLFVYAAGCGPIPFMHVEGTKWLILHSNNLLVDAHALGASLCLWSRERSRNYQLFVRIFFVATRIVFGIPISIIWFRDMISLLQSGQAHSVPTVLGMMFANLLLNCMNLWWMVPIISNRHIGSVDRTCGCEASSDTLISCELSCDPNSVGLNNGSVPPSPPLRPGSLRKRSSQLSDQLLELELSGLTPPLNNGKTILSSLSETSSQLSDQLLELEVSGLTPPLLKPKPTERLSEKDVSRLRDESDVWNLYGNQYDLSEFIEQHPGGSKILQQTQGVADCTSLFESYHALANIDSIKTRLSSYLVKEAVYETEYDFTFYHTLRAAVRKHMALKKTGSKKTHNDKASLTSLSRPSNMRTLKVIAMVTVHLVCFLGAFWRSHQDSNLTIQCTLAAISAVANWGFAFCGMHDASHFAMGKFWSHAVSVFGNVLLMWDDGKWIEHHVIQHHTHTGHPVKDPDTRNCQPFIRKTEEAPRRKYVSFTKRMSLWGLTAFNVCILGVFPGMWFGQVLIYNVVWPIRKTVWGLFSGNRTYMQLFTTTTTETFTHAGKLLIFFSLLRFPLVAMVYVFCMNVIYAVNILPDHDTNATANAASEYRGNDWARIQICNSANFGGKMWAEMFGGINYQIEHHLFPSLANEFLPEIAPIVSGLCKKWDCTYTHFNTVESAVSDTLRNYNIMNSDLVVDLKSAGSTAHVKSD